MIRRRANAFKQATPQQEETWVIAYHSFDTGANQIKVHGAADVRFSSQIIANAYVLHSEEKKVDFSEQPVGTKRIVMPYSLYLEKGGKAIPDDKIWDGPTIPGLDD